MTVTVKQGGWFRKTPVWRGAALALCLAMPVTTATAAVWDKPERRRDQFAGEFSYFVYPLGGDIPGLGSAFGLGGSALNIAGTDTDFTAFNVTGDFSASGYTLLDMPLRRRRLVFDLGVYDFDVAATQYHRGIDSSPDDTILPHVKGKYALGQLTLTFDERRYETYLRLLTGSSRLLDVRDETGQAFAVVDTERRDGLVVAVGGSIDLTDDRLDPRRGLRLELAAHKPRVDDPLSSEYFVADYNVTFYLPLRQRRDSLVFNYFQSDAHVTNKGSTDYAVLQAERGLNCAALPTPPEVADCLATEDQLLTEYIAANRHGNATSLGGTQRLRSFDNGRFYAGHALSYGIEYRWNLTDEYRPFDIYIARGVRTGIQLAFFAERGSVADRVSELGTKQRTSYGAGFRLILSGVVLRGDYAFGDEGQQFQFFIGYPWSTFSIDNPG
jgi:hypothetical protein